MRAVRLTAWKHSPEIQEVPEPEPGPGQVAVRIGGAGACHSDLHLMHDFEAGMLPFDPPFTLGHENAGWVEAIGPGSSAWRSVSRWRSTDRGAAGAATVVAAGWRTTASTRSNWARSAVVSAATAAWRR
jgi:D-arabinose 1-dehydrogenase-like Zn-dependent alcohol dehydrogenase